MCQVIVFRKRATRVGIPKRDVITITEQQTARRLKEFGMQALAAAQQMEDDFHRRFENGAYLECREIETVAEEMN